MGSGNFRNRDLTRMDRRVNGDRYKVPKPVYCATQEVESRAKIGNGGGREGFDGGENGFGFSDEGGGGEREVAAEESLTWGGLNREWWMRKWDWF